MKEFFDEDLLLGSDAAKTLYATVKDLPIVDYHCHLNQEEIAADVPLTDIGELWLAGDHYKWRAMRLCGVDERLITGNASFKDKFLAYARIMPKLIGNPLYYFSHLELKQVFGIHTPLCEDTAEVIYVQANEKLNGQSVCKLLECYKVEYLATTDDPADDLNLHKKYGKLTVAPTFRPDKYLSFDVAAIKRLGKAAGIAIKSFEDLKTALSRRLDYFALKGCRISDHGFLDFPAYYSLEDRDHAEEIFKAILEDASPENEYEQIMLEEEKDALRGELMVWLMQEYKKRNMMCQLHFSVVRSVNPAFHKKPDTGFDVMTDECSYESLVRFLQAIPEDKRPLTILYSLNPNAVAPLCNLSGAFRNVLIGAAWWFNDTLEGIRRNLSLVSEYAVLGTSLGMLTDSRSFLSYSRFDFFRRILCDFVGTKVSAGEYPLHAAEKLVQDICYYNIKRILDGKEK